MKYRSIHERAEYLGNAVFAGSDGIITTFAVVAGATGAALTNNVILILGFANLLADGFSMAAGNYLGHKSEQEYEKAKGGKKAVGSAFIHGIITFFSFNVLGLLPLLPFVIRHKLGFELSVLIVGLSLFLVGILRGRFTKKNWFFSGVETLLVGGFAAIVAFVVGYLVENFLI